MEDKKLTMADLDKFYIQGKLSEAEYIQLATEDINVLAIAVDRVDGITTVSLTKEASMYAGEVMYPLEETAKDEKFLKKEPSLAVAKEKFISKISALEKSRGHEFEVSWYFKKGPE